MKALFVLALAAALLLFASHYSPPDRVVKKAVSYQNHSAAAWTPEP